jgi:uncharacterized protein DUF1552
MMITKRCLPRRTFLRGVGVSLALPLLDSMVPALSALATTPARPVRRLGVVYLPNGIVMEQWTPALEGDGFALTPILQPLAPFRDRLVVLTNLAAREAFPLPGEGAGDHARASATFLTGVHVKKTEGADLRAGISMDQVAAREVGRETQLASLEMTLDSPEFMGSCDAGYSCAYANSVAWRSPTTPLPMEADPRAVFERLFGDSGTTDPRERLARIVENRSVLDSVGEKVASLRGTLGPGDQRKLAEFLDAVRDVERRIEKAAEQSARELPVVNQPAGIPPTFEEYAKLMFDLQVLAYQCDLTRVFTLMMGREVSSRTYPEIGVPDPHHPLSHHQGDTEKIAKVAKINVYHATMFGYFLERLRTTADGDGSLLDHAMIVYGGAISDGNQHLHDNLPILVAGGGGGIKGGRHLRFPKDTPVTNLYVTLLDKMGVPAERLGDSTGRLEHLTEM